MPHNISREKGFTLLELIVVIAIFSILGWLGITTFQSSQNTLALGSDSQVIIGTLTRARQSAIASNNRLPWGVHFTSTSLTLFSGPTYNASSSSNAIFNLSSQTYIASMSLNGTGSDVIFSQLDGAATSYGTITLALRNNPAQTQVISVLPSGVINTSTPAPQLGTRIQDSRRINARLGWSIQNSATLSFIFSKPGYSDTRYNVTMSGYFDPTKSEFLWSGTFSPFNTPETLEVHTHYLDSTSTVLCIHRYGDENSLAVQILIDNQSIVSYSATGQVTQGSATLQITNQ